MTKPQDQLYWREFAAATRYCKTNSLTVPDRHALHIKALGRDKSHTKFSNDDFDKVLAVFRALSKPTSVNDQLRQLRQTQTRLLHKIQVEQAAQLAVLLQPKYYLERFPWLRDLNPAPVPSSIFHLPSSLNDEGFRAPDHEDFYHAERYILAYCHDVYKCHSLLDLDYKPRERNNGWLKSDLECLRDTIAMRISELRRKHNLSVDELRHLAGLDDRKSAVRDPQTEPLPA